MKIPRRIILSRKGFDSKFGGCASPILPDGMLVSMPITEEAMPVKYQDIQAATDYTLGELTSKLKGCNVRADSGVHLDPDVRKELHKISRAPWRPIFGQSGIAARHLAKRCVDADDLFLFFGWFRRVDESFQYQRDAADEHVIWGWLQVDGHPVNPQLIEPEWAKHHPHFIQKAREHNQVYVGRKALTFQPSKPGAGAFAAYRSAFRLTCPSQKRRRSDWEIPSFFQKGLTYHDTAGWVRSGSSCTFSAAKIGQEFVFDTSEQESEVQTWLKKLFADVANGTSY